MKTALPLDYAANRLPAALRLRRVLAILLVAGSGMLVARYVLELAYRLQLFHHTYGGRPFASHVDNGTFKTVYLGCFAGTMTALVAMVLFSRWPLRTTAALLALANIAIALGFFAMHRSAMLVEYGEWARHLGP